MDMMPHLPHLPHNRLCIIRRQLHCLQVALFLAAPLAPEYGLGLYIAMGDGSWAFRGYVASNHPSDVFPLQVSLIAWRHADPLRHRHHDMLQLSVHQVLQEVTECMCCSGRYQSQDNQQRLCSQALSSWALRWSLSVSCIAVVQQPTPTCIGRVHAPPHTLNHHLVCKSLCYGTDELQQKEGSKLNAKADFAKLVALNLFHFMVRLHALLSLIPCSCRVLNATFYQADLIWVHDALCSMSTAVCSYLQQSFGVQQAGDKLLVPANCIDRWFQKFSDRFRCARMCAST
jgi:hypothetical protein